MRYFADCHFHAMTMKEPNFTSFINSLYTSPGEFIASNATDNYIITTKKLRGKSLLDTIENTLQTFSRPIGETFCMMEDDLMGRFASNPRRAYEPETPFISEGKLKVKNTEYDKMIMTPLLMDFSENLESEKRVYYPIKKEDKLTPYIDATLEGIDYYYQKHPDGLFEFYPFVGINPKLHSFEFMENLLEKYVNTSHTFHNDHTIPNKPFYGIKLYPPLDFAPWPKDPYTLEKHKYLYDFCQKNNVPIITHCDDQGFRGISASLAWKYTSPDSWRIVLENYPKLKIDFAHFGKQYAISSAIDLKNIHSRLKGESFGPWTKSIIKLMSEYDGVYADLSFTGASQDFYEKLNVFLSKDADKKAISRIIFGSDFSVNLLKVESYTEYFSIFDNSQLDDENARRIASDNAIEFLGLI